MLACMYAWKLSTLFVTIGLCVCCMEIAAIFGEGNFKICVATLCDTPKLQWQNMDAKTQGGVGQDSYDVYDGYETRKRGCSS